MDQYEIDFLNDFIALIKKVNTHDKGKWGVLNAP
jgi:hypothetical protein